MAIILNTNLNSALITSAPYIEYLNSSQFVNCKMIFTGKIANQHGEVYIYIVDNNNLFF